MAHGCAFVVLYEQCNKIFNVCNSILFTYIITIKTYKYALYALANLMNKSFTRSLNMIFFVTELLKCSEEIAF